MNLLQKTLPTNRPVTVFIDGGLGNQMFQYAFGRTIADRRASELYLDCTALQQSRQGVTPREYSLDSFNIRATVISNTKNSSRIKFWILRKWPFIANFFKFNIEVNHNFQVNLTKDNSSIYFRGYWQSHLYFTENKHRIFNDFLPKSDLSINANDLIKLAESSSSVMIHVRRGDYISLKSASEYHASLNISYYKRAYENIFFHVSNPIFFIFSDDIEWCKSEFSFIKEKVHFIPPNKLAAAWEDLIVMSHCKHQIIANSSFSWWSAWLADYRFGTTERFVSAPNNWFVKETIVSSHRFPEHWLTL